MKTEKSCGCIIIDDKKVLLISAQDDEGKIFWSFPKGHQEAGETDFETAIRETKEETNLNVTIIDKPPIMTSYLIKNNTVNKQILFFFAKLTTDNQQPKAQQGEVQDLQWVAFDQVDTYLKNSFPHHQKVWQVAQKRLKLI